MIGNRVIAGAWAGFRSRPLYPASAADRRSIELAGLDLPVRATIAAALVTLAVLFDYSRTFVPDAVIALGRSPDGMLATAIERVVLFGLIPLTVVVFGFRDRPSR